MSIIKSMYGALASILLLGSVNPSEATPTLDHIAKFTKVGKKGDKTVFKPVGNFPKDYPAEKIASDFNVWDANRGDAYVKVSANNVGNKSCVSGIIKGKTPYVCVERYSEGAAGFISLDDTPSWKTLLNVVDTTGTEGLPVQSVTVNATKDIVVDSRKFPVYNGTYSTAKLEVIAFDRDGDRGSCPPYSIFNYEGKPIILPECITDGSYGLLAVVAVPNKKDYGILDMFTKDADPSQVSYSFKKRTVAPGSASAESPTFIIVPPSTTAPSPAPSSSPTPAVAPSPAPVPLELKEPVFDHWEDGVTQAPKFIIPSSNLRFVGGAQLLARLGNLNLQKTDGSGFEYGDLGGELRALLGFGNGNFNFGLIGAYRLESLGVSGLSNLFSSSNSNIMSGEAGVALQTNTCNGSRLESKLVLTSQYLGGRQNINDVAGSNFLENTNGVRTYGTLDMPRLIVNLDNIHLGLYVNLDTEILNLYQTNLNNNVKTDFGWKQRGSYLGGARLGFNVNGTDVNLGLGFNADTNYSLLLRPDLTVVDLINLQMQQTSGRMDLSRLTGNNVWGYSLNPNLILSNDKFYLVIDANAAVAGDISRNGGCLIVGNDHVAGRACYEKIQQVTPEGRNEYNVGTVGITVGTDRNLPLRARIDAADRR